MDKSTREVLLAAGTATLCTLLLKRGFRNVCLQGIGKLNHKPVRMAGPAYTLRYIPAREDIDVLDVFNDHSHPQRVAVEQVPAGHVLVMDCRRDAGAASAGAILAARLQFRNCEGLVTDGGIRDSEDIAAVEMPVFCAARSAPTNLTRHHAVDINTPIACGDVAVYPDDIIVGDSDGVIAIPGHIADEIAMESVAMNEFEQWAMRKVQEGRSIVGLYPPDERTRLEYENSRK